MGNSPECCFEDKLLEHTRAGDVRHQRSQQTRFLFLHDGSPPIPPKKPLAFLRARAADVTTVFSFGL